MISRLIDLYREATNVKLKAMLKEAAEFAFQLEFADKFTLTSEEIEIGQYTGKIACVKLVRERTEMSLIDAKQLVEKVFNNNYWKFKGE